MDALFRMMEYQSKYMDCNRRCCLVVVRRWAEVGLSPKMVLGGQMKVGCNPFTEGASFYMGDGRFLHELESEGIKSSRMGPKGKIILQGWD